MSTNISQPAITSEYTQVINNALEVLGVDDFVLIIHGGSFPKSKERDTGFGSPYGKDAEDFIQYVTTLGFNGIQLGPAGKTKSVDRSPYTGTLFSSNPLFIDFYKLLETPLFGQLLKSSELARLVEGNPSLGENRVAYEYLYLNQQAVLDKIYSRYTELSLQKEPSIQPLTNAFDAYKKENKDWLEKDALYEALTHLNGTDYWPHWKSDTDRLLLSEEVSETVRQERITEVLSEAGDVYQSYQFTQFILNYQKKDARDYCESLSVKLIADHQVAFSDRDIWANQSYFLPDFKLGAPPDYFSKSGQAWGFPVLHPQKCFDEKGSPKQGAESLKRLFSKVFMDNPGGVRIDHIIGLIDPWVYPKGGSPKPEDGAARLFSSPEHPDLCHYTNVWHEDIDWDSPRDHEDWVKTLSEEQIEKYARVIDLILSAADELGAPRSGIICEDLGTLTHPVKQVLSVRELSGIRITQFVDPEVENHLYRGSRIEEKHWVMPGSHDNKPLTLWVDEVFKDKALLAHHSRLLSEDLSPPEAGEEERLQLFETLCQDKVQFLNYKLAEIFASPSRHVQLFFADLFGMGLFYNRPGLSGRDSWTLRLPSDYKELYQENIASEKACHLPTVLSIALKSKGNACIDAHQDLLKKLETASWSFSS